MPDDLKEETEEKDLVETLDLETDAEKPEEEEKKEISESEPAE